MRALPDSFSIKSLPKNSGIFVSILLLFLILLIAGTISAQGEEDVSTHFSQNYQEARSKFITSVKSAGGNLEHYRNPNWGPKGGALYTDVATFNLNDATTVLVLGSGTHGVEGFAGSGIQVGLLREGITRNLPKNVGLLFYHGLNPYGFSHLRRVNEDNVDLNRNFLDRSQPYPPNEEYIQLANLLEPKSLSKWAVLKVKLGVAWYRLTKGKEWLQKAVSQGQYSYPNGLFYGGNSDVWSNRILREIAETYLSDAKRIVLIDYHTGLGDYGAAEVIVGEPPSSGVYQRAKKWWGDIVKSPDAGDSVSPPIKGSLKYAFARMAPDTEVTAVSLEFGTYPPSEVFWALWRENYVHHHPNHSDTDREEIKAELLRVFYPDDAGWRAAVWRQGRAVSEQVLKDLQ